MKHAIMAVGPHCDDVEFQFGATLLKYHRAYGYRVVYVEATNNMSGAWMQRDGFPPLPEGTYRREVIPRDGHLTECRVPWFIEMPQRKKEAEAAARTFFDTDVISLDCPQGAYTDGDLKQVTAGYGTDCPACTSAAHPTILTACKDPREVARVRDLILREDPEVIFCINVVDLNPEHCATAVLIRKAFLEAQRMGFGGSLLFPAPLNPTGFGAWSDRWDTFVDTTGYEDEKRRAIGVHACQMPDPARLDLMDRLHGALCGCGEAEAYDISYLAESDAGALTAELARNRAYCEAHYARMFFSGESKKLFSDFWDRIAGNY